jgi:hypothetical protein
MLLTGSRPWRLEDHSKSGVYVCGHEFFCIILLSLTNRGATVNNSRLLLFGSIVLKLLQKMKYSL